jgi:hypothetical protein
MDYQKHYDLLVARSRDRVVEGYTEKHHIVPRCMGGGDEPSNLVRLTAAEHYVAHQLLVKIYPDSYSLLWALSAMTHSTRYADRSGNKRYAWLRQRFAKTQREKLKGIRPSQKCFEARQATIHNKRGPLSEELKAKLSAAAKGRKKSASHIANLSKAKIGATYPPRSEDSKRRSSEAMKNSEAHKKAIKRITADPAYKALQSANMKRIWAERKQLSQINI